MKATTLQLIISEKLQAEFEPDILSVIDESFKHADHNPDAAQGGTHFRVKIVSKRFKGVSKVERHRWVYAILHDEMKAGLHALALTTQDSDESTGTLA
ncbi:BolA family protein [Candidatus Paracaedibacter symbiosus]|uniref:BolA family protein n=1 Tax=Candidatus Paracaedibacter symbiosus TaxID=244582 RepID=UPI000509C38B|nr:BolA family protein [Candidatus Paracaedibacter symbiosus]